jgi:uncharacterized cupredoxin-like copper-binding protein
MAMFRTQRLARALVAAFLAGDILLAGLGVAGAQSTPAAHPAFIRSGACGDLGGIAYPLTAVPSTEFATADPLAAGAATAHRAVSSVTLLGIRLIDLLAAPHAVTVQDPMSETAQEIVCGDIGGVVTDGELAIGLQEMNGSGDTGLAVLRTTGSWTTVTVYLVHALAVPMPPTEGLTPVQVTLTDLTIAASQTTFRVGAAYAFVVTNHGTTEHELVLASQRDPDQPVVADGAQAKLTAIPPGQSKTLTWTFTEPGDYLFACHMPGRFEAGMYLPIEVTTAGGSPTAPNPLPPPQPVTPHTA